MKSIIKIAVFFLAVTAASAAARHAEYTPIMGTVLECQQYSDLAEGVMEGRQQGTRMYSMFAAVQNLSYDYRRNVESLIREAYDYESFSQKHIQKRVIDKFKQQKLEMCLDAIMGVSR